MVMPRWSMVYLLNIKHDVTHIHSVNAKRCKVDNDSPIYLWHCRLSHVGVKRMKKLHADELLESLDYESTTRDVTYRDEPKNVIE